MGENSPPADYENLVIESEDTTEYSVQERRKMLYKLVKEKGDPSMLPSYTSLGDRFGVTHGQISQDMKYVKQYIRENIGQEAKVRSQMIFNKAIEEKVEDEDWEDAVKMISEWNDWLFDIGAQQKHNKDDVNVAVGVDNRTQVNQLMERLDDGLETARSEVKQGDKDFVVEKTEQVDPEES